MALEELPVKVANRNYLEENEILIKFVFLFANDVKYKKVPKQQILMETTKFIVNTFLLDRQLKRLTLE